MIRELLSFLTGKQRAALDFQPSPGQLLSVRTDDGRFGVMKLLAVDEGGVHARLYVQRFDTRPRTGEIGELTLAASGAGHDHPFSIGHMPLSHQSFAGWQPALIGERPVTEDELEGRRMWREAEGGYF